ncbi:unnamed protein product [Lota lota]
MEGRGYGSGYSSWGGGGSGSRGSNNFDMYGGGGGYKDSMSGLGGYGGGGQMKRGLSGGSLLSSSSSNADAVIAKINQRLDMLTQLEGGMKGGRSDRFDQYESFDSRQSSLASSRDLYRSSSSGSYGYGDGRGDNMLLGQRGGSGFGGGVGLGLGGGYDSPSSSYGVAKMRQNMRDSFGSGQGAGSGGGGWASASRRSPRRGGNAGGRGAGGGFGSRKSDPTPLGGGRGGGHSHRGHSPGGGRGKLPSLLSNRMYPESGGFHQGSGQGPHDFPGRHFGGGPRAGRQRGRKRPLNRQVKPQRDGQKKRKQMLTEGDEPESKMNKTDVAGAETDKGTVVTISNTSNQDDDLDAMTSPQGKQSLGQGQDKHPKPKKRRGFLERVMFACSVCKFRSFYKEDMAIHLQSRFHKDHFKFLSSQLSKPTTDFLQEYLQNKFDKTKQRVSQLENHSAAICQVYKEQDLTREIGMEHFMRKVEAAHCAACDLFIPMQHHLIQKHIKSPDHNYNRKGMMEQSKRGSLSVARSILNHKIIGKKLESYLKGENPFIGNQDEQDPEDSMEVAEGEGAVVEKMEEEEAAQQGGNEEEQEEEGFEVGDEEGYVVEDEISEDAVQGELEEEEEEEGVEAAAGEIEGDKNGSEGAVVE